MTAQEFIDAAAMSSQIVHIIDPADPAMSMKYQLLAAPNGQDTFQVSTLAIKETDTAYVWHQRFKSSAAPVINRDYELGPVEEVSSTDIVKRIVSFPAERQKAFQEDEKTRQQSTPGVPARSLYILRVPVP
jgi:hypothetical protein